MALNWGGGVKPRAEPVGEWFLGHELLQNLCLHVIYFFSKANRKLMVLIENWLQAD